MVWFVGDVDPVSCLPFVVPEGEEVDGEFEFVFNSGDLVVCDRVIDLVEAHFGEESLVSEWALMIFGSRIEGRQQCISEGPVPGVFDFDDCMFVREELW